MSNEGLKLFNHKPKKSKLKPSGMSSLSSAGATDPPPPPPPPLNPPPPVKEPIVRFKFYKTLAVYLAVLHLYRMILNFWLIDDKHSAAYAFARTVLKVGSPQQEKPEETTASTAPSTTPASAKGMTTGTATTAVITEQPVSPPSVEPIPRAPIPEEQQRELLKWILEEKRKTNPRDAEERKRIDEEEAILKQLIRAKSIPTI